jgi:WD40 repeat protein
LKLEALKGIAMRICLIALLLASLITGCDPVSTQPAFHGHKGYVYVVRFSPDGKLLASGGGDGLKVWDVATGKESVRLEGHEGLVSSVSFSPDGTRIASGSWDETIRLWNASTGEELHTLKGHTSSVTSVAFSPDGQRLASASYDKTVKLWDAATGQETLTLKGHSEGISSVSFSPDGQRLASAGGTAKVVNPVGSKNSAELKVPRFTRLKVRRNSPSQPLDFNRLPRKLAICGAEHVLPSPALAHSAHCLLRHGQPPAATDH